MAKDTFDVWADRPVSGVHAPAHAHWDRYERVVKVNDIEAGFEAARQAILAYDVYPEDVLIPESQDATIAPGTLILQHFKIAGKEGTAGIRIHAITDDPAAGHCSLAYRTLKGHPECGEISFTAHKLDDAVHYIIAAWSVPGTFMVKLFRRAVRKMQLDANERAVQRMVDRIVAAGGQA